MISKANKIDKKVYEKSAELYRPMANAKRLEILDLLGKGEKTVTELVDAMGIRKANVSQHLAILRYMRFVNVRRVGKNAFYSVSDPKIAESFKIMNELCKKDRFSS